MPGNLSVTTRCYFLHEAMCFVKDETIFSHAPSMAFFVSLHKRANACT